MLIAPFRRKRKGKALVCYNLCLEGIKHAPGWLTRGLLVSVRHWCATICGGLLDVSSAPLWAPAEYIVNWLGTHLTVVKETSRRTELDVQAVVTAALFLAAMSGDAAVCWWWRAKKFAWSKTPTSRKQEVLHSRQLRRMRLPRMLRVRKVMVENQGPVRTCPPWRAGHQEPESPDPRDGVQKHHSTVALNLLQGYRQQSP